MKQRRSQEDFRRLYFPLGLNLLSSTSQKDHTTMSGWLMVLTYVDDALMVVSLSICPID